MNNWCICWFFTHIFTGILIFKGLTARRLFKSFGIRGLSRVGIYVILRQQFLRNVLNRTAQCHNAEGSNTNHQYRTE
jgi:hypothetical protein